jgi:hypothetical protein
MPTIDQLAHKEKKKFVKSDYRPWNYMEEIEKESNENQLEIKEESNQDLVTSVSPKISNQIDVDQKPIGSQLEINDVKDVREDISAAETTIKINTPDSEIKAIHADSSIHETTLDTIFRLTGHQKRIFMFIFERCASRAMLSTGVIKGEILSEITNTTKKMVKTSIQRLVGKNLIQRERGKTGRGGFYVFSLTALVRNATLEYKRMVGNEDQIEINRPSLANQSAIKQESLIIDKKNNLPEEWMKINIYPLEDIGFNQHHLKDIYETQLADPQMVQESILHFAYGVEYEAEKYKQYTDFLNVLIGRLRKGKPWFEKSYRSPQEIAQSELIEAKKNGLERKRKLEEEAFKMALAEWQEKISQAELAVITEKKGTGDIMPASAKISKYFRETVWPEQKRAYLIAE